MVSFEDKKAIFLSFNLKEKEISNGRVSFVYPESKQRGQVLATQLHPSGNGYVIGKYMSEAAIRKNKYNVDHRGWISIRDFSKEELKEVIIEAKNSMAGTFLDDVIKETPERNREVHSFLLNWVNLSVSMMELGLMVWKRTLKVYSGGGNND